jgi:hypothetical protein
MKQVLRHYHMADEDTITSNKAQREAFQYQVQQRADP